MPNVRAFRSGAWSDTNPATSPWGTGGVLYAPAANDDVYSNTWTIHVDQNVTVNSVTNGSASSRLWKDGETTGASRDGTFNLLNGVVLAASNANSGSTANDVILLSGSNSATFVGTANGGVGTAGGYAIRNSGSGTMTIVGSIVGGSSTSANYAVINSSNGNISITGPVIGGTSTNSGGLVNASAGTIVVTGYVTGGTHTNTHGINNSSTGTAIVVGNVIASAATNAFVSSNASAINKISANIIDHPNGTAAIYAARYVVDPVPTNGLIQYSNVNMFTTDSLSAFSMPPVGAVRSGVSFANNTLTGTCRVPSPSSVTANVPVDNTVGIAVTNIQSIYETLTTSLTALTGINTVGSKIRSIATTDAVGNVFASFTNG